MLFYIIFSMPFILLAICGMYYFKIKGHTLSNSEWRGNGFAQGMTILFIITTLGFILASLITSSDNIFNQEDLKKVKQYETILTEKAELLTVQFTTYLAELYPDLERGVFESISPENINIYLVKYPELQSSKTIMKLVDEISKLQDAVYTQKLKEVEIQRDINYYYRNPWLLFTY